MSVVVPQVANNLTIYWEVFRICSVENVFKIDISTNVQKHLQEQATTCWLLSLLKNKVISQWTQTYSWWDLQPGCRENILRKQRLVDQGYIHVYSHLLNIDQNTRWWWQMYEHVHVPIWHLNKYSNISIDIYYELRRVKPPAVEIYLLKGKGYHNESHIFGHICNNTCSRIKGILGVLLK